MDMASLINLGSSQAKSTPDELSRANETASFRTGGRIE